MSSALEILGLSTLTCDVSVDGKTETAVNEMKSVYQERLPYTTVVLLDGLCYLWSETFIDKAIIALSTDVLSDLTTAERKVLYAYIDWSNHNTHSADLNLYPTAIGCTVPDEVTGISYVVLEGDIVTTDLCDEPLWDILKPELYKSLDTVFMNKIACLPYNTCGLTSADAYEVSTCSI
jgi:hypothetical protein